MLLTCDVWANIILRARRQAANPEQKWEHIKPILAFADNGKNAKFEPQINEQMTRFVTAKKLGLGCGQCVRLT